ncbi:hypothetical protein [Brachybacterium hainanense]|uniref:Uncharacterized protein n=1 Tax=Brachybacterium hainanense TaxID=1541174 RepID=A0ABV6R9B0_9MICO
MTEHPPIPATPPEPATAPDPALPPRVQGPLFSTILWGLVLLVFAAAVLASLLPGLSWDPAVLAIGALVALGLLLLLAGLAAALRRDPGPGTKAPGDGPDHP